VNATTPTAASDLMRFITKLRPQNCGIDLIRIGARGDGGYLIPDDLEGIEYCFSPGVYTSSAFETHLADLGIRSFLADYSVDGPAIPRPEFTFDKKFIGAMDRGNFITLASWKAKHLHDYTGDLILQMDIEGTEYEVILTCPDILLGQFRIIVVEFHYLDWLFDPFSFRLISACFDKLLEIFQVVHIHPNNGDGSVRVGKIIIPRLLEFTFLNRKRVRHATPQQSFPHPLDADNAPGPTLALPKCWYCPE
jgi:hypothetical protein